jgi:hypothetical protein
LDEALVETDAFEVAALVDELVVVVQQDGRVAQRGDAIRGDASGAQEARVYARYSL